MNGQHRLLVALALAGSGVAHAQRGPEPGTVPAPILDPEAPRVSAAASSQEVGLGQTFSLFVSVVYQAGVQVNLPAALPLGPAFEETARTDATRVNADGTITRDFEVLVMAFEVGDLVIPSIAVTYAAHGRAHEVATLPVSIRVVSFIGEGEATLRDIAGPVRLERPDLRLVYGGAGAAAALVLLIGFLIARRSWRRRHEVLAQLPEAVQRSAHEEALARLDELEASGALDAVDRKPVYLAMSEILRVYIGRRFAFPALDLTTFEIRRELGSRPGGPAASDLIAGWLERADLVKFAGHEASADEARQALYDARIFIDRTRAGLDIPPAPEPAIRAAEGSA